MHNNAHTIHGQHFHYGWDNAFPPVETIAPGTTLTFECKDSGSGHFTRDSTVEAVAALDFSKVNPVTGPVFVDGAERGDILKVTIEEFSPCGFGWTAIIPGFGLLADDFKEPGLTIWNYDKTSMAPAAFSSHGKVPLKAFPGTIGLAPAEAGHHSVVPPRRVGGNLDMRDLNAGAVLYLKGLQPRSVEQILMTPEPWFENDTGRLEFVNRAKFWRYLTGDDGYDADYWLTRLENLADA